MGTQPLRKYAPGMNASSIDSADVAVDTIIAADVAPNAITASEIAANAVTAAKVADPTAEGGAAGVGLKVARVRYDFAVDGGGIGTINLFGAANIPANALVVGLVANVTATFVSATDAGTVSLGVEAAADLVVAIAIVDASNPWDAGTHQYWGPVLEQAVPLTTVARDVPFVIAVEALTAGSADFYLFYVEVA